MLFLLEHDLFRKPVSTFRDHALDAGRRYAAFPRVDVTPALLRGAAALLGYGIVVAALERNPIANEIFRSGQVSRPSGAGDQALGLPHHVELAVGANFADEDRLGDVMVRQQLRDAAGQV